MKNIIKIGCVLTLLFNGRLYVAAQYTVHDFAGDKEISPYDSAKLHNYLVGYGILSGAGNFVKNRRVYIDSALSIVPWSAELWLQKGLPLIFSGKYELGMPCLDSAVKYAGKGYIGYRGYVKCIFQKQYKESITDLIKARQLNSIGQIEDHPYSFFIGLCYLQLNMFDSSENIFKTSINKVSDEHGPMAVNYLEWFYYGINLYEKDEYGAAIACFDSSLIYYPQFSDAKFYKAWCLKEQGQYPQALALMKESQDDLAQGNTINDDNAHIEPYPYQVSRYNIEQSINILNKK
jgi:tetratricopeptide (TPR) repeat protein